MFPIFALVIIDMSQEQVYRDPPFIPKNWTGFSNILKLSKLLPQRKVFDSRLWMKEEDHSTLYDITDVGRADTAGAGLVSDLNGELQATFVKKLQYSSFYNSDLEKLLRTQCITDILLTGINTDYCVLATALDAFYLNFKVHLVEDACATFNGAEGHKQGIQAMQNFLTDQYLQLVSTKDAIELLKLSNH